MSYYSSSKNGDGDIPTFQIQDVLASLGLKNGSKHVSNVVLPEKSLEYLFEDEYAQTGQSFGSRLCYGTGSTYLLGLAFGGGWGLFEGLFNPNAKTARLRLNCILNAMTQRGPFIANHVGLIAFFYNFIHGGYLKMSGKSSDFYTTVGSASLAGALFRASKGPKSAALAALVCGSLMGGFDFSRNFEEYSYAIQSSFNTWKNKWVIQSSTNEPPA